MVLVEYYDIIYKSRVERVKEEIDFVEEIFREDVKREVKCVFDLVCGIGILMFEFVERGYEVFGFDLYEEMLRVVRWKVEVWGLNVKFIWGNVLDISFEEEFDVVMMFFFLIMYFDDFVIWELFNFVRRMLRLGGVFIVDFLCWFYGGNDGLIVWDERRGDERFVIIDWWEVELVV